MITLIRLQLFSCSCDVVCGIYRGHVESLLLTNSNATAFHTASMRSSAMTSFDDSASGWSDLDDERRRSLVYTDGRAGTLRCLAVARSSPVRVEVSVGRRNVTGGLQATRTVTTGGRPGMRLRRYAVELTTHLFRPGVDESGRRLTCTAHVDGRPVNATSVRLVVRRKPHHCQL